MYEKTITAKVEYVKGTTPRGESIWIRLKTNKGLFVGVMSREPRSGEKITFNGKWDVWRGQKQFKFTSIKPFLPEDSFSKLEYACELTKGIGPALVKKIWAEYDENWETICEDQDNGILKGDKFIEFKMTMQDFKRNTDKVKVISWILSKNLTTNVAEKAWKKWGVEAISVIDNNCYEIATLENYGFSFVDNALRLQFGIGNNDLRRVKASIHYILSELIKNGSTAITWASLHGDVCTAIGFDNSFLIAEVVGTMINKNEVFGWSEKELLSPKNSYLNEKTIWEFIS